MESITWLQLFILALSSFRLTHLIVYDQITWFLRRPFVPTSKEEREAMVEGSWRYWIGSFITCHWCVGIWSSLIITLTYLYLPWLYPLFLVLAIAGLAAIFESLVWKK